MNRDSKNIADIAKRKSSLNQQNKIYILQTASIVKLEQNGHNIYQELFCKLQSQVRREINISTHYVKQHFVSVSNSQLYNFLFQIYWTVILKMKIICKLSSILFPVK